MKRNLKTSMLPLLLWAVSSTLSAEGLVPSGCSIGDKPVYAPISTIGIFFDEGVRVLTVGEVCIRKDGVTVARGTLETSDYTDGESVRKTVSISFGDALILPKGGNYTLVVPEGCICAEENESRTNRELLVDFAVPAYISAATPSVSQDAVVSEESRIGFYFDTEIAAVDGAALTLLREGIPVGTYPCQASWDWDLGYAGVDFGERMKFEDGVRYSLMLPEGSVCSLHRPDILNREETLSFTGGCRESAATLDYVWCSLFDSHPDGTLGEVTFHYTQPVVLAENAVIQLCETATDNTVKEVVPKLEETSGKWLLTADFGKFPLLPAVGYSIVIPEGTLMAQEGGKVLTNRRSMIPVADSSGISLQETSGCSITCSDGVLRVEGVVPGTPVSIYTPEGRLLHSVKAGSSTETFHMGQAQCCIVCIGHKAVTVAL